MENRVYGLNCEIDTKKIQEMYSKRAEKKERDVDAPVVLSSDTDINNIAKWTDEELERWFPKLECDKNSRVFELGYGTGRMSKYIIDACGSYLGIDNVADFREIAEHREDIKKGKNITFLTMSFDEYLKNRKETDEKFNRFFISGGVFMYMNDDTVDYCVKQMSSMLDEKCIIYISEPVAVEERLTLKEFYSESMKSTYSAIYRTEKEYQTIFAPLYASDFQCEKSELFFEEDFKKQKETRQWMFLLKR